MITNMSAHAGYQDDAPCRVHAVHLVGYCTGDKKGACDIHIEDLPED